MARATIPIFCPSCGRTRITTGPCPLVPAEGAFLLVPATTSALGCRHSGVVQLPAQGVVECIEGGVDDVWRDADRRPALAGAATLDQHASHGFRPILRRQDAHLVVLQTYRLEYRIMWYQRLAQRLVEGIHRAIAIGDRHERLVA